MFLFTNRCGKKYGVATPLFNFYNIEGAGTKI
jgi:hypothetical protein